MLEIKTGPGVCSLKLKLDPGVCSLICGPGVQLFREIALFKSGPLIAEINVSDAHTSTPGSWMHLMYGTWAFIFVLVMKSVSVNGTNLFSSFHSLFRAFAWGKMAQR